MSCFEIIKSYVAPSQTVEEPPLVEEHTNFLEWILDDMWTSWTSWTDCWSWYLSYAR
jgi:hypothetical protein